MLHNSLRKMSRGFTMVEIMVVVAIIVIISTILMFEYKSFDSQLLLRNQAYEITTTIHEMQVYGISVRGDGTSDPNAFNRVYGIHFTTGTSYLTFRDINTNGRYDGADAVLSTFSIGRGNEVSDLCVKRASAVADCSDDAGAYIDVTFKRPDPDALINAGGVGLPGGPYSYIRVILNPINGTGTWTSREVLVFPTGQISIR